MDNLNGKPTGVYLTPEEKKLMDKFLNSISLDTILKDVSKIKPIEATIDVKVEQINQIEIFDKDKTRRIVYKSKNNE